MSVEPVAGWYPDPAGSDGKRWWDGNKWSDKIKEPESIPTDETSDKTPSEFPPLTDSSKPQLQPPPSTPALATPAANENVRFIGGLEISGFAVASFLLGLLWIFGIGSLLAIIFALIARGRVKRGENIGKPLATAGLIMGILGLTGIIIVLALPTFLSQSRSSSEQTTESFSSSEYESYLNTGYKVWKSEVASGVSSLSADAMATAIEQSEPQLIPVYSRIDPEQVPGQIVVLSADNNNLLLEIANGDGGLCRAAVRGSAAPNIGC